MKRTIVSLRFNWFDMTSKSDNCKKKTALVGFHNSDGVPRCTQQIHAEKHQSEDNVILLFPKTKPYPKQSQLK